MLHDHTQQPSTHKHSKRRPETIDDLLHSLRRQRGFDAAEVLAAKLGRINRWWQNQHLDAAVVGLSGGIDSAVVAALLHRASHERRSPLRRVVAIAAPIEAVGATHQPEALHLARVVADHLGIELWVCPLAEPQRGMVETLRSGSHTAANAWAQGQMLSVLRTPLFYGAAALLQQQGYRSVVVGTTNRDEGAYLGYFGKASDGMVDVQPIADLHKHEVRTLAQMLDIPAAILAAAPNGGVWDGRTDEEMIGTSYDLVEAVLRLRELEIDPTTAARSLRDGSALRDAASRIESLHTHNRHKYAAGSSAAFLDVLPRAVPGGWRRAGGDARGESRPDTPPSSDSVPGWWQPPDGLLPDPPSDLSLLAMLETDPLRTVPSWAIVTPPVLHPHETDRLVETMYALASPAPVGVTGAAPSNEKAADDNATTEENNIGSLRATAWSPDLARALWGRLRPAVPSVRFLTPLDATDGHATNGRTGHRTWRAVGLSPLLRFMRYDLGGHHLVHYDAGYDYGDGRRTLLSVVFFLTGDGDPARGGQLRFVDDGQSARPVWERDHHDWDRPTCAQAVHHAVAPTSGTAVVFDHRLPHDVEPWRGPGLRVIIRADVVYEAVDDGRGMP